MLQNCGLGIVLLKLYATTGSFTPDARLKSLILATGVTYRNHCPTISQAELTSNAAPDTSQVSRRQSLPNDYSSRHEAFHANAIPVYVPSIIAFHPAASPSQLTNHKSLSNRTSLGHAKPNRCSEHRYQICRIYCL